MPQAILPSESQAIQSGTPEAELVDRTQAVVGAFRIVSVSLRKIIRAHRRQKIKALESRI
jgi:hypothetical protein